MGWGAALSILSLLGIPAIADQSLELADRAGMDATGRGAKAKSAAEAGVNASIVNSITGSTGAAQQEDLSDFIHSMEQSDIPMSNPGMANADAQFMNQLFASEGLRLNQIAEQMDQHSFITLANRAGLGG